MPSDSDSLTELQRLKLMQELQRDLTQWARSRLALLSVAVAVLGFFGMKTVLEQSVASLVDSKVNEPVQSHIRKLEAATEKAADKVNQLTVTNELVTRAGQDAEQAANEVQQRLAELQPQIDRTNRSLGETEQRLATVKSEAKIVRDDISHWSSRLFDKFRQQSFAGRQVAERIATFEIKQAEIAAAFQELAQRDPQLAQRAANLMARFEEIDRQYRDSIAALNKRSSTHVILMVGKGEANEKIAQLAEKHLQSYGYFASVYYPYGASRKDRLDDFERDFAGLKIDESNTGPVIYINDNLPEKAFHQEDIRSVLQANKIATAKIVTARFAPAQQYLRRSDDERFEPSNIIVFYFPMANS